MILPTIRFGEGCDEDSLWSVLDLICGSDRIWRVLPTDGPAMEGWLMDVELEGGKPTLRLRVATERAEPASWVAHIPLDEIARITYL